MHKRHGTLGTRLTAVLVLALVAGCTPASSGGSSDASAPPSGERMAPTGPDVFELVPVAEDVYATVVREGFSPSAYANSLIVLRDDHALVVDSRHTVAEAERLILEVRGLTDLPVRYLVNTHWHGDHVQGNHAFREHYPDVRIIGHASIVDDMSDAGRARLDGQIDRITAAVANGRSWLETGTGPDGSPLSEEERRDLPEQIARAEDRVRELESIRLITPDLLLDDELLLDDAEPEVRVSHLGPAHTRGDLLVWVADRGVLAVGDLLEDGMMYFGDGYPSGWAEVLDRLSEADASILFPAHGPVLRDRDLFETERRFVAELVAGARDAAAEGAAFESALDRVDFSAYEPVFTRGDTTRSDAFGEWVSDSFERAFREATGDLAVSDSTQAILRGSRRALGGIAAVRAVSTLRAEAGVVGPAYDFVTIVWSARDGRARMEQSTGFAGGAHPSGEWRLDRESGAVADLDPEGLAYVRGHELHASILFPESRYSDPRLVGQEDFAGRRAHVIRFTDGLDEPVLAYYSTADSLPLGFRVTHTDPDVIVTLDDWETHGSVRLFTRATFTQGEEAHEYSYVSIRLNGVPDSVFASRHRLLEADAPQADAPQ